MRKYLLYPLILCVISGLIFFLILQRSVVKKNPAIVETPVPTIGILPKPFVVLIVPGHDTNTGGAQYKSIYERNLVVSVADDISSLLSSDPKYKVIVARNTQTWNPIFATDFLDNKQAILDFKNQHQAADKALITSGQEKIVPDAANHSTASETTAIELYGINKWADENAVDLVIHLHFNSSARKNPNLPGTNRGFDMFIPDAQRTNSPTSRVIAEDIYTKLEKKFAPETPGNEYTSLYEDQSLIALGASNTLTKPAILIEYAYLYEKMLQTNTTRKKALESMAEQTVAGIQDYVNSVKQ